MGVLTKYDQIEPIYLPQNIITYIYLHPVYCALHCVLCIVLCNSHNDIIILWYLDYFLGNEGEKNN
jgi:hypothetical protein